MGYRVDTSTWQSDFSDHATWLYVVDNNGRHFIINHETQTRYELGGAGSRNAAQELFGNPITDVFLTGYQQKNAIGDLFDPNEMEQIISGRQAVPSSMQGSLPTRDDGFIQNATDITAGSGHTYTVPESYAQPEPSVVDEDQETSDAESEPRNFEQEARALFPSMPEGFIDLYASAWQEHGSNQALVWQEVRQDPDYSTYFPGNLRDNGTTVMNEAQYLAGQQQFEELLSDYGVPASEFQHKWADLVAEEKSLNEFAQQAASLYQKVVLAGPAVKEQYAEFFSGDISNAALFSSALDPSLDPLTMEQRIRQAQIGAEAGRFGFDLALREAERMAQLGLDVPASRQFFGRAKDLLPTLGSLIARHGDPNDEFDLEDLSDALILQDPDELDEMERLFAQESATFTPTPPQNVSPR